MHKARNRASAIATRAENMWFAWLQTRRRQVQFGRDFRQKMNSKLRMVMSVDPTDMSSGEASTLPPYQLPAHDHFVNAQRRTAIEVRRRCVDRRRHIGFIEWRLPVAAA